MSENIQTQEVGVVTGKVISNKMDKSIVVLVERQIRHPIWQASSPLNQTKSS